MREGSWRVGAIAGIGIFLHWTFALLVGWLVLAGVLAGAAPVSIARSLAVIAAVFGSVVVHELGHALAARRFGVATEGIAILPIGGMARLASAPRARAEIAIALAGPVVSLGVAAVCASAAWLGAPVAELAWINLALAAFNLVPAFPLDGGRVLRAALATRIGEARATRIAVRVGRVAAVGMIAFGVLGRPVWIVIGVFLWIAGEPEMAGLAAPEAEARSRSGEEVAPA
jgi:Zn-dependent protease